jgi:hypothetical protein
MQTSFSGPVQSDAGFAINQDMPSSASTSGMAGSYGQINNVVSAIAQTTATRVLQVQVPNANNSAVVRILVRSMITAASHIGDSTRVVEYLLTVTRHAGAAAVAVLSAAIGAQIATVAAGQTLTSTLGVAAVSGGVTALNTLDIQVTNTVSSSGISETQVFAEILNYQGVVGNYPGAPATTGITLSP